MSETTSGEFSPARREQFSGSTKDVYCQILKVGKIPASPADMPRVVYLPSPCLGDLESSILLTGTVLREHSQAIDWDSSRQRFVKSSVLRGTRNTEGAISLLHTVSRELIGRTPLVFSHTHPDYWHFSVKDVAIAKRKNFMGYFSLVGSGAGVAAIFRTERSRVRLFPQLYFILDTLSILFDQMRLRKKDFYAGYQKMAELLEGEGFAFYFWGAPLEKVKQGDMREGIRLSRVYSDKPYEAA